MMRFMCFSAEASFIASGFLATCSAYTIKKTLDSKDLSFMCIALIPLLFAIQQFSEGFIWLFLGKDQNLDILLSYLFLFFAFFLWPVWVPLSLAIYDKQRQKIFFSLAVGGLIFGIILYITSMFFSSSFNLYLCKRSLCYEIDYPIGYMWASPLYYIFTIFPFLLCTSNYMRVFGILMGLSAVCAALFFIYAFTSVWCFFAAILSAYICFTAYKLNSIKLT